MEVEHACRSGATRHAGIWAGDESLTHQEFDGTFARACPAHDSVTFPPADFPPDGIVAITTFNEALEVLRSAHVKQGAGTRTPIVTVDYHGHIVSGPGHETHGDLDTAEWEEFFRRGSLARVEGDEHNKRRRPVNPLFSRDAHLWFRDNVLAPTLIDVRRQIAELRDSDGIARMELVNFAMRIFVQVTAKLVGFDRLNDAEMAQRLVDLSAVIETGRRGGAEGPITDAVRTAMEAAMAARTSLMQEYYLPSLARRKALVEAARNDANAALPHDYLTLVARGIVPHEDELGGPHAGLIGAIQHLQGSTGTNTDVLVNSVAQLDEWFALHTEDRALRTDPKFLAAALHEALRLRGAGSYALSRVALRDITLSTGRVIHEGQYVAILNDDVNRDTSVFGPDAAEFNPRRVVPTGTYEFGLAFGSGTHMCIGLPLVLGQGGLTGLQVPVLQVLFEEGISRDPTGEPQFFAEMLPFRHRYKRFPVLFSGKTD